MHIIKCVYVAEFHIVRVGLVWKRLLCLERRNLGTTNVTGDGMRGNSEKAVTVEEG